ncbi:hypothetical protein [Prosthecodimorpha staleyi]|uniref:Uncharacterized protein n=1 Tax=Prosthecodimorpha staleyi TaxID=2840188 RepID=A0A947D8T5_9HYPH|nr:hypothetical protein [Prosthecodimorpha staleyi]MBT9290137.1 hypothetical protein [Prosthecodimorpha staleyi]
MSVLTSLTQGLRSLFGGSADAKTPADDETLTSMLAQRITILQSRLAAAKSSFAATKAPADPAPAAGADAAKANAAAAMAAEIEVLEGQLKSSKSWNTANFVELRLLDIIPDASVRPNLQATLQEGRVLDAGLPAGLLGTAEAILKDDSPNEAARRVVLRTIVEHVQWVETKKYRLRRLTTQIANMVLLWAMLSTFAFSMAILLPLLAHTFDRRAESDTATITAPKPASTILASAGSPLLSQATPSATGNPAPVGTPAAPKADIPLLERPFGLIWAFMFGIMGANLSILYFFRDRVSTMSIEEAEWNARGYVPATKLLIGGLGAVVVYFFLRSEIVTGLIAPKFADLGFWVQTARKTSDGFTVLPEQMLIPSAELAKLAVWSLIAGTSESFVPSVLRETEQKLSARAAKTAQ